MDGLMQSSRKVIYKGLLPWQFPDIDTKLPDLLREHIKDYTDDDYVTVKSSIDRILRDSTYNTIDDQLEMDETDEDISEIYRNEDDGDGSIKREHKLSGITLKLLPHFRDTKGIQILRIMWNYYIDSDADTLASIITDYNITELILLIFPPVPRFLNRLMQQIGHRLHHLTLLCGGFNGELLNIGKKHLQNIVTLSLESLYLRTFTLNDAAVFQSLCTRLLLEHCTIEQSPPELKINPNIKELRLSNVDIGVRQDYFIDYIMSAVSQSQVQTLYFDSEDFNVDSNFTRLLSHINSTHVTRLVVSALFDVFDVPELKYLTTVQLGEINTDRGRNWAVKEKVHNKKLGEQCRQNLILSNVLQRTLQHNFWRS